MSTNNTNDLFVRASRKKLRISTGTGKGSLSVEDLWDLSLPDLDRIAVGLAATLQGPTTKSFLTEAPRKEAVTAQEAFDVVKTILDIKVAEKAAAQDRATRRAQRDFLKNLLAEKEVEGLKAQSPDEIRAKIAALGLDEEPAE